MIFASQRPTFKSVGCHSQQLSHATIDLQLHDVFAFHLFLFRVHTKKLVSFSKGRFLHQGNDLRPFPEPVLRSEMIVNMDAATLCFHIYINFENSH